MVKSHYIHSVHKTDARLGECVAVSVCARARLSKETNQQVHFDILYDWAYKLNILGPDTSNMDQKI